MAKRFQFDRPVERVERLTRDEQEDLLFDLLASFQIIKDAGETALFIQDLLTRDEAKRLAKRLRIAKLLLEGMAYGEIEDVVHTSHGTIAKVAGWLAEKGDGFRRVLSKLPKRTRKPTSYYNLFDWGRFKRQYSAYFWPEFLLEEIIKNASRREKERLKSVINNLDSKSKLHRRIEKIIKEQYVSK